MFNDGEQKIIKVLPKAIEEVKKDLGLENQQIKQTIYEHSETPINYSTVDFSSIDNGGMGGSVNSKKNVRIRTDGSVGASMSTYREPDDYRYNFNNVDYENNYSDIKNNSASSFVLIVAAVVALISVVSVVTFGILNIIGYNH